MIDLVVENTEPEDDLIDEPIKKAEPKGHFNFLNLDEVEAFKEQAFGKQDQNLFNQKMDWKEKQRQFENAKEYMVSGLITDYVIRDGKNSGEKVAFITLEDYSGSYSFRLGDRDYMKLRDKLAEHRFVIIKIKFTQANDGRVFVNVTDVLELKEAFEKFAKSLSLVIPVNELKQNDLAFFKNQILSQKGEHKLNVYLKNPADDSFIELRSMYQSVHINANLIGEIKNFNKYEIYLN